MPRPHLRRRRTYRHPHPHNHNQSQSRSRHPSRRGGAQEPHGGQTGYLQVDGPVHFVPLADEAPPATRPTPMVAPETASPNQISGERTIDGVRVTFRAIHLPVGQWEVRVVDAMGELTKDIDDDPWTMIALMVEQAVAASRERLKELAQ